VHGLFGHRRPRKLPSANLTPASGCQDHATSPSASSALVRSTFRVHRIPPRARDDRETPLRWDGTVGNIGPICASVKQKYFCVRGLTAACTNGCLICPSSGRSNSPTGNRSDRLSAREIHRGRPEHDGYRGARHWRAFVRRRCRGPTSPVLVAAEFCDKANAKRKSPQWQTSDTR